MKEWSLAEQVEKAKHETSRWSAERRLGVQLEGIGCCEWHKLIDGTVVVATYRLPRIRKRKRKAPEGE